MADNTTIAAMDGGDVIATDDIGGIKHQRVKVGHGADGSYADASAAAPLPVSVLAAPPVGVLSGASVGSALATVAAAGTRVQLADHPNLLGVTVRARLANADRCFVGGSNVSAANGYELAPGEAISLDVANTDAVYVDAAHSGDAVAYVWVTA